MMKATNGTSFTFRPRLEGKVVSKHGNNEHELWFRDSNLLVRVPNDIIKQYIDVSGVEVGRITVKYYYPMPPHLSSGLSGTSTSLA